jgi:hypothetical protein
MSTTDEDSSRPPARARPGSRRGAVKGQASCALCGRNHGEVKVYRDPFGTALAPGRWPNLTMHSDCFLTYIRVGRAAVRELTP